MALGTARRSVEKTNGRFIAGHRRRQFADASDAHSESDDSLALGGTKFCYLDWQLSKFGDFGCSHCDTQIKKMQTVQHFAYLS